ncbi:MAG TPA: hypothetical protein VKT27_01985 [Candidatus Binataceae bacterium]|nr:hypothetical protein [Candidatus Binataceae bacterium]
MSHGAEKHNSEPGVVEMAEQIHYREYKLLLKPERFADEDGFHKFYKHLHHVAKSLGAHLEKSEKHEPHIREVVFYDTPHFKLYTDGFILRKRTFFKKGHPEPNFELTIRFRHPDAKAAGAVDMHPLLPCIYTIKFKEEILQLHDKLGGMRMLYANGCELDTPNVILTQRFEIISQVFPALQRVRSANPKATMGVVNDITVDETLVHLGELDFGGKAQCKASMAVWRNRSTGRDMIAEFGYQLKFQGLDSLHRKPRELSEELFKAIQMECSDWVALGTTKTAMVYGLGHKAVGHNE